MIKKLESFQNSLNKIVSYTSMWIFIVLIIACVAQVFFRFILNHSLSWTEELARFSFIWMHILGASLLIKHSQHAQVTALFEILSPGLQRIFNIFIQTIIIGIGTIMVYSGVILSISSRSNKSTAMSIPMWTINISVAIGGLLLIIQGIITIVLFLNHRTLKEGKQIL